MTVKTLADDFGKGLFAGFAGTLAITASQTIEMKLRERPPSSSPADAAGRCWASRPRVRRRSSASARSSTSATARPGAACAGSWARSACPPTAATAVHFVAVSGAAMVDAARPQGRPARWGMGRGGDRRRIPAPPGLCPRDRRGLREAPVTFLLTSPVFDEGASIPQRHTCDGENVSPALAWRDAPAGTQGFALLCHDPDSSLRRLHPLDAL